MQLRKYYWVFLLLLLTGWWLLRPQQSDTGPASSWRDMSHRELVLTRHAKCRMACRHIDEGEIRELLQKGKLNTSKSEPDARPSPRYALEGTSSDGQQLRIIVAPEGAKMVVITVIDLGREWACHCP
ncbi:MAG TPA: DUF4258 domain-containing protein [Chitinophagaceae bacterium]|nr:DUF4258 domain-containing protein [Chitinophagaceae bacterium]